MRLSSSSFSHQHPLPSEANIKVGPLVTHYGPVSFVTRTEKLFTKLDREGNDAVDGSACNLSRSLRETQSATKINDALHKKGYEDSNQSGWAMRFQDQIQTLVPGPEAGRQTS